MLPQEFLDRMKETLGGEYEAFLASYDQPKYQALRLNALKRDDRGRRAAAYLGEGGLFAHLTPVPWAENGYYYETGDQPGKHPYHEAGVYYIQEPSAMAPAELLEVSPEDRVLDLCAAPGGKSTQLAAKLDGKGFLLCNEIHPARAKILSENIERMGIGNACVTNETPAHLAEVLPVYFDKILVDAPCSGEGMFRKNEAACEEWSPENVQLCAERQREILDCAASMLRPGGRLVYSTCTFSEEEDEGSIRRFLTDHPDFTLINEKRLWPHKVKGEGHYMAVCVKAGDPESGVRGMALTGSNKPVPERELDQFFAFCEETLSSDCVIGDRKAQYLRFGDNLYLAPEGMPGLKGLKVLRPGLHLGELKKNRFEPSHALAHFLSPADVQNSVSYESTEKRIADYLNGQTFSYEGEKGWYLVCVDGFSLGWGKLAGNVMKNHYPKGLRVNF